MASVNPLRPTKLWWLVALLLLCLSLVIQLPAQWLVQKFAPNNPYLQQISGNLWQGQANWQLMTRPNTPLAGTLDWQWQPWHLFTGNLGMKVVVRTGSTNLQGVVEFNQRLWQAENFNGKITHETLSQLVSWQLPDAPIQVKDVAVTKNQQGYQDAKGTLNWAGGTLVYPSGGQTYLIKLPIMVGTIGSDKSPSNSSSSSAPPSNDNSTAQAKRLQVALTTPNGERLGDIAIDPDNMVDIALTQRLLKNMPNYQGNGADDSTAVSLRQPLSSMSQ